MPNNDLQLPSYEEEVVEAATEVTVHLDLDVGSTLLTNFYRTIKFKLNSNIIIKDDFEILNEIISHTKHDSKSLPPQLLYRGTRDGFKAQDFHSRCDNQGPTLTIIKSAQTNQIFGGFTTQSWNIFNRGRYISDSSAFLFKINHVNENNSNSTSSQQQQQLFEKFNIQSKHSAIYTDRNYLPVFGKGYDLCIVSDCHLSESSYSHLGYTYELDDDEDSEYREANRYLAGCYQFKVLEIEVFQINLTSTRTKRNTTTQ